MTDPEFVTTVAWQGDRRDGRGRVSAEHGHAAWPVSFHTRGPRAPRVPSCSSASQLLCPWKGREEQV